MATVELKKGKKKKNWEGNQGILKTGIFKMLYNFISSKLESHNSSLVIRRNIVTRGEMRKYNKITTNVNTGFIF